MLLKNFLHLTLDANFSVFLAGMMYSVNRQCQFVFGASAEICPYMVSFLWD